MNENENSVRNGDLLSSLDRYIGDYNNCVRNVLASYINWSIVFLKSVNENENNIRNGYSRF